MKLIFGIGSHLYIWDTSVAKVQMQVRGAGSEDSEEEFESAPTDPHGTLSSHLEISPSAIYEGANEWRFGFGRKEAC